ncbi:killer cell lectin-like receptor subfamily F member 1 [Heliangelus exortis]|uniref:killer cell lectin-like receptor subfamily F member 1 n=1 Tax=Heliangelus exortis TaxID=472823 RepID=UPI003A8F007D
MGLLPVGLFLALGHSSIEGYESGLTQRSVPLVSDFPRMPLSRSHLYQHWCGQQEQDGDHPPVVGTGFVLQDLQRGSAPRRVSVQAGAPCCPRYLLRALMATLLLALVVCVSWLVAERGQFKGRVECRNTSQVGECAFLACASLELRKSLCPLRGGEVCKLCPPNWRLWGTKCLWASDGMNSWRESQRDCMAWGAELLIPEDQDELDFLNEIFQKPTRYFWIGLSFPSAQHGWTWLNGSCLDQNQFPLSPWDGDGRACGALRGDKISSSSCDVGLQWICQKEATDF